MTRYSFLFVCIAAAAVTLGGSLADAAEKKIVLEGKFGRIVSTRLASWNLPQTSNSGKRSASSISQAPIRIGTRPLSPFMS